jgi:hypothetical protein
MGAASVIQPSTQDRLSLRVLAICLLPGAYEALNQTYLAVNETCEGAASPQISFRYSALTRSMLEATRH